MDDDTESRIARHAITVLAYLRRHPTASDTVDGIARWWLRGEEAVEPDIVGVALDRLVAAGRLERTEGPDGVVRYGAPWVPPGRDSTN